MWLVSNLVISSGVWWPGWCRVALLVGCTAVHLYIFVTCGCQTGQARREWGHQNQMYIAWIFYHPSANARKELPKLWEFRSFADIIFFCPLSDRRSKDSREFSVWKFATEETQPPSPPRSLTKKAVLTRGHISLNATQISVSLRHLGHLAYKNVMFGTLFKTRSSPPQIWSSIEITFTQTEQTWTPLFQFLKDLFPLCHSKEVTSQLVAMGFSQDCLVWLQSVLPLNV